MSPALLLHLQSPLLLKMSIDNQKKFPLSKTASTSNPTHPKASYEQVVADSRVFKETLEGIHQSLGTKLIIPTIGGKPLDLHRLFVEVTCRGGLEKVIEDCKWRDVVSVFAFPPTTTSASYLLRKYYIALLRTYEQVYFFQKGFSKLLLNDANTTTMIKNSAKHQIPEQPTLRVGCNVKGKISGKFEYGYIVTANFGSKTLNGVLYPPPLPPSEKAQVSPPAASHVQKRRRKDTDSSTIVSSFGGYNIFFVEHYSKLRPLYSGKEKAMVNKIFTLWSNLTEFEKEVYKVRDKERCKTRMSEYKIS